MKIGEDEQCRTTSHGLQVASIERRTGERAMIGTPSTELHRLNVPIALGTDWPVAEFDPRLGMAWARLRRAPKMSPARALEPHQVLDAYTALAGYTTVAAAIVGDPCSAGQVAEGMRADLTGFASGPVTIPADELIDNPVMLAVVGGRIVHRAH